MKGASSTSSRPTWRPPCAWSWATTAWSRDPEFDPLTGARSKLPWTRMALPGQALRHRRGPSASARSSRHRGELAERVAVLKGAARTALEAQRLEQRTRYDMEMLREIGFCHGIENYSRHLSGRPPGERPDCLIDFFPKDFLCGRRRVARHRPADRRHVRGRPLAQADPGRLRLPPALGARQPPAQVRRVRGAGGADRVTSRPRPAPTSSSAPGARSSRRSSARPASSTPRALILPTEGQLDDLIRA